jgi:hypothetical protein
VKIKHVKKPVAKAKKPKQAEQSAAVKKRPGPVPILNAAKQTLFLRLVSEGQDPAEAADMVGSSIGAVISLGRRNEAFKAKFTEAKEGYYDGLEMQLGSIARKGNLTAIFGILNANRREKWAPNKNIDLSNKDGSLRQHVTAFLAVDDEDGPPRQLQGDRAH